jgi:hypothetical protein
MASPGQWGCPHARHPIGLLTGMGHTVRLIEPGLFANYPCPFYPEIRIAWPTTKRSTAWSRTSPGQHPHPHRGDDWPVVRSYCLERGLAFTTSYHTKIPEYLRRMIWFRRRQLRLPALVPQQGVHLDGGDAIAGE